MGHFSKLLVAAILAGPFASAATLHFKTIRMNTPSGPTIVTVDLMPANPKQGDQVSALIQLTSTFSSPTPVNTIVTASLDSATAPLPLIHPSANAWIAQLGVFGQISNHTLNVNLVIQDTSAANTLQAKINNDNIAISKDQDAINNPANATNPGALSALQAQLATDQATLAADQTALTKTLSVLSTQNIAFSISAADSESSIYPHISQISPNYGTAGTQLTIEGSNFGGGTLRVLIGGVPATIASSSSSAIQVTVPQGLSSPSLSNIEVDVTPTSGAALNAIAANSFYSIPASFSGMPVAVINPISSGVTGSAINLIGTSSTGGTGGLTYAWSLLSEPSGSTATLPATGGSVSFTPDIGGTYIVGLQVTDSSGNQSQVSVDVVNVTQPAGIAISYQGAPVTNLILQGRALANIPTQTVNIQNTSNTTSVSLFPTLTDAGGTSLISDIQLFQADCQTPAIAPINLPPSANASVCIQLSASSNPGGNAPTVDAISLIFTNGSSTGETLGSLILNTTLYAPFPLQIFQQYNSNETTIPSNSLEFSIPGYEYNPSTIYSTPPSISYPLTIQNTSNIPVTIPAPAVDTNANPYNLLSLTMDPSVFPLTIAPNTSVTVNLISTVNLNINYGSVYASDLFSWNLTTIDSPYTFYVGSTVFNSIPAYSNAANIPVLSLNYSFAAGATNVQTFLFATQVSINGVEEPPRGLLLLSQHWPFEIQSISISGTGSSDFTFSGWAQSYDPQPPTQLTSGSLIGPDFSGADFSNVNQVYGCIQVNFTPTQPNANAYSNLFLNVQFVGFQNPIQLPITVSP